MTTKVVSEKITVGTSWTTPDGRAWEVYGVLPFGRARVRSGARFGDMYHRDIRPLLTPA